MEKENVSDLFNIEHFALKILLFSVITFGVFLVFLVILKFAIDNKIIYRLKSYL